MEIKNKNQLSQSTKISAEASKKKTASYYYEKGITHYNSGEKEEAEINFSQAIETDKDNSIAYFNRGTFYYNEKKYKEAIEDFIKAIRLKNNFAEAYYNLACAYVQILSFREGLANLKKAIKHEKGFAEMAMMDPDFTNVNRMTEFREIIAVV